MKKSVSGTLFDPIRKISYGAIVFISKNGRIAEIIPDSNPDPVFIIPGFIDAHVHIESSMLTPAAFANAASRHGTVAAVADPHEIANVLGIEGVRLMIRMAKQTPFVFGFGAPSCVPSTPFETAGAELDIEDIRTLLKKKEVTHLAEMMDFPGVIRGAPDVLEKLQAARDLNKPIDGHAPGLGGKDLKKYIAAGITTDHESLSFAEAAEKINCGMTIMLRHGSAAGHYEHLLPLIARHPESCMFCSDDKHPDDLLTGHINTMAATAYRKGISIHSIIQAACVNPVQHYNLPVGLLQLNDPADFILVDNFNTFRPLEVWIKGECVVKNGISSLPLGVPEIKNNFHATPISWKALQIPAKTGYRINVIKVNEGTLITNRLVAEPKIKDGLIVSDIEKDIIKLVVYNRYHPAKPAVAFITGLGIKRGAIASSVTHDSHNIIAAGASDIAIITAINEVIAHQGGLAVTSDNAKVIAVLPLPLAGLISPEPVEAVARQYSDCDRLAKILGSPLKAPFMTLSFMALPVIPELKLTDKGLFNVKTFTHTDLLTKKKVTGNTKTSHD
ncbi:MAG: adenine deaminase [Kiritimatiellae bacterium]|nr:adenine deaminase [Kiritimatiellia bacterium]